MAKFSGTDFSLGVLCCFMMLLVLVFHINVSLSQVMCVKEERESLIKIRSSFVVKFNFSDIILNPWIGRNCCEWHGVYCDRINGHVIKLDLHGYYLKTNGSSVLDPSLVNLKHLTYLDLNGIDFQLNPIPSFIGSMKQLIYLDLSLARFSGRVPSTLGNLTKLHYLHLRSNYDDDLRVDDDGDMDWIYNLTSLKLLDMSGVNLGNARALNLMKILTTLPSLNHLYLIQCQLHDSQFFYAPPRPRPRPHPDFFKNATFYKLEYLDLASNNFSCSIPIWMGSITSLKQLYLKDNQFHGIEGGLLSIIRNTCHLEVFDLSNNNLGGNLIEISEQGNCLDSYMLKYIDLNSNKLYGSLQGDWLGQFKNLVSLDLSDNLLSGPIPSSFLTNISSVIQELDLSGNLLSGPIPSSFLTNISSVIQELDLSGNLLSGPIPSSFFANNSILGLDLSDNNLNGSIPTNLGQLQRLERLYIHNNSFEGVVSDVHLMNLSNLVAIKMGNQRHLINWKIKSNWVPPFHKLKQFSLQYFDTEGSEIPQWLTTQKQLEYLDLSNGDITGIIPTWLGELTTLSYLDLSNNQIRGSIPKSFGALLTEMLDLNLMSNQINGTLPTSLCKMSGLVFLDISENRLSGSIPNCWSRDFSSLMVMSLSSNNLSGVIPNSLENLYKLKDLRLGNNHFYGEIPSLANFTSLKILDLQSNQLSGDVTKWVGNGSKFRSLIILSLRENKLIGSIPSNLCRLRRLRILDFAHNNISGTIPSCLGNLPAMMGEKVDLSIPLPDYGESKISLGQKKTVVQVIKGREFNYSKIGLTLFVNLDLSNNKMSGSIPIELTQLTGLIGLNLSHNNFSGMIPAEIGRMRSLESLDLSCNHFFGSFPISMLSLTSLEVLNVSYNNISGSILQGKQFSTLNDPFCFIGNPYLCGDPLPTKCEGDKSVQRPTESSGHGLGNDADKWEKMWLYIIIMLGYAAGFWGVIGVLIFKKSWRYACFQFADEIKDRIYVEILVHTARLKRLIQGNGM